MQSSTVYSSVAPMSGPFVTSTPHLMRNFCPASEVWMVPLILGHSTTIVGVEALEDVLEAADEDLVAERDVDAAEPVPEGVIELVVCLVTFQFYAYLLQGEDGL